MCSLWMVTILVLKYTHYTESTQQRIQCGTAACGMHRSSEPVMGLWTVRYTLVKPPDQRLDLV